MDLQQEQVVLILMNVQKVLMIVMIMQHAQIQRVVLHVNVMMDMLVMEQHVKILMNVQKILTIVLLYQHV